MKTTIFIIFFSFFATFCDASTVVLPKRFQNAKVLIVDTVEYKKYVEENKELKDQLVQENKNWLDYSASVENQIRYNIEVQSKILNDFNKAKIDIQKQQTTIAKQRFTILSLSVGIGLFLFVLGILLYTRILKFGLLPF